MVKTRNRRRLEAQSLGVSSPEPRNMDMKKHRPELLSPRRSPRRRTNLTTPEPPSPGSDIEKSSLRQSSSSTLRENEPVEISTSDSEGSTSASNTSHSASSSNPSHSTPPASSHSQPSTSSPTALSDSCNGETSVEHSLSSSDDEQHSDNSDEQSLPKRLFANDRYPTEGRVNSYSKPQYLLDILTALRGTPELEKLKNSPFSVLFDLPVRRCSLSGKLLHNVLCRQILTTNDEELWFTFGGYPLRFSLLEFERVTRLRCGPYPDKDTLDAAQKPPPGAPRYWNKLIGRHKKDVSIKSIVNKLKSESGIPGWKKFRLALLVIVEGVLLCGTQPIRASDPVVEMLRNLNFFFSYPWGRHSFEYTIRMVKVGKLVRRHSLLIKKLKQPSLVLHGFPIAIQLMLFDSIPLLLRFLPASHDLHTFYESGVLVLPKLKTYHTDNILQLENENQLCVTPTVSLTTKLGNGCPSNNSSSDPHVRHMLSLLEGGYKFSKRDWRAGDESLEKLCICKKKKHMRCRCGSSLADDTMPTNVGDRSTFSSCYSNEISKLRSEVSHLQHCNLSMKAEIKAQILSELKLLLCSCKCAACGQTTQLSDVLTPPHDTNLPADRDYEPADPSRDNTWESDNIEASQPHIHETSVESSMEPDIEVPRPTTNYVAASDPTFPLTTPITQCSGLLLHNGHSFFQRSLRNLGFPPKFEVGSSHASPSTSPTLSENFLKFLFQESTYTNSKQAPLSSTTLPVEDANLPVRHSQNPVHVPKDKSHASAEPLLHIKGPLPIRTTNKSKKSVRQSNLLRRPSRNLKRLQKGVTSSYKFEARSLPPPDPTVDVQFSKDHATSEPVLALTTFKVPPTRVNSTKNVRKMTVLPPQLENAKRPQKRIKIPQPVDVPYVLFPSPHPNLILKFKKKLRTYRKLHYEMDGVEVSKTFFSDIYTPQTCLFETHLDFILTPFWRKRGSDLAANRVVVLDTLLTQLLSAQYPTFRDQSSSSSFYWDPLLSSYIEGSVRDRKEKTMWFRDVDTLFVPMNWGNGHWVELVICLQSCHVEILDPLVTCTSDTEVGSIMQPFMEMLPSLIKASCTPALITHLDFVYFSYSRVEGVPQNVRGGDSGPFVIKLIELHSQKYSFKSFADFPDDVVDNFRMQYAIDVYQEFVSPLGV